MTWLKEVLDGNKQAVAGNQWSWGRQMQLWLCVDVYIAAILSVVHFRSSLILLFIHLVDLIFTRRLHSNCIAL
jgi:hypothetical protein